MNDLLQKIITWAPPVLLAITLHEAAHGYVARMFGDNTASDAGRISLNPFRHIDPVGTVLLPAFVFATSYLFTPSGIVFGWAKPVPVNFARLHNPKRDMFWVAAAGPFANLLMVFGWAVLLVLAKNNVLGALGEPLGLMSIIGIQVNGVLMLLNLLPILPLDGGRIVVSLLPNAWSRNFAKLERLGFPILLILLFSGGLNKVLGPMLQVFINFIANLFGI